MKKAIDDAVEAIDEELPEELKVVIKKNALQKDPFLRYGIGIKNYFELQRKLIWIFLKLSVVAIIQMIIYRSFDGLGHLSSTSFYTRFSFGMMGFAGNNCGKSIIYFDNDLSWEDQ